MEMVHIYPLPTLRPSLRLRLYQAQQEAARVWTVCRDLHLAARQQRTCWPRSGGLPTSHQRAICPPQSDGPDDLPPFWPTSRRPENGAKTILRSLSVQGQALLPVVLAGASGERGARPHRLAHGPGATVLGLAARRCPSRLAACKLVWKDGYELHVSVPVSPAEPAPGRCRPRWTWGRSIRRR